MLFRLHGVQEAITETKHLYINTTITITLIATFNTMKKYFSS